MDRTTFFVRVSCMTYNHAPYIVDAMNGFCMQETSFPFVCVIVDDASVDGEQEVIQKYLDEHFVTPGNDDYCRDETTDFIRVFARHKKNRHCFFVVVFLKYNHYSLKKSKTPYFKDWTNTKYIALCEGDDYWIDSRKLERQYNFLNEHPDYSMCFHNTKVLYENTEGCIPLGVSREGQVYADEVFSRWTVPTASIMFRKEVDQYKTRGNHRILYGDIMLILKCAEYGKLWGMKDVMSVYRVHSNSAIHNAVNVKESILKEPHNTKFILDNFDCVTKNIVRKRLGVDYYRCFCVVPRLSFKALYYLCLAFYYNPSYLLNMALKTKMYARRHEKESNNII